MWQIGFCHTFFVLKPATVFLLFSTLYPLPFSALSLAFAHCLRFAAPLWQPCCIIAKIS